MLTLLVEPRKTLQTFLDDIRQIRNNITVQKTLSSAQIQLLDNYYAQIARPVQRAFEEGRTRVNPAGFMAVDASELHTFWEKAQKMDRVTGGDLFEVRDTIEKPTQRAPRTPNSASSSFPVRYGGGWRYGDCHRGGRLLAGDQQ